MNLKLQAQEDQAVQEWKAPPDDIRPQDSFWPVRGAREPSIDRFATDRIGLALSKAQSEIRNPKRNKTAKVKTKSGYEYQYSYADLEAIIDSCKAPLAANELALSQTISFCGDKLLLETRLIHSSGQSLMSVYPLSLNLDSQALGSQITFGRRYCLAALLCICASDDLDGGVESDIPANIEPRAKPKPEQPGKMTRKQELKELNDWLLEDGGGE
jgi:hypothetical protein